MRPLLAHSSMLSTWTAFAALTLLSGCAGMVPMPVVQQQSKNLGNDDVLVGIAEVDITPPVGLGMFGHGPESRVVVGTQLRLRCQVFVIIGPAEQERAGEAIALVPCDLAAPSLLLQRTIAEQARKQRVPLGASDIMLMATHTHAAPGHFYAVHNYVNLFSSRLNGFDSNVLEFLASTIARGLASAYHGAKRARIGWSQGSVSNVLSRNRNPQAILQNKSAPAWLVERVKKDHAHVEEAAVDPTISVLRIDRYDETKAADPDPYVPYGVFATFGMHPTALANTHDLYSGDVFGYATRYAASALLESSGRDVIVGIANGIEGDVMAARTAANVRESRRFGRLLAREIFTRWESLGAKPDDSAAPSSARAETDARPAQAPAQPAIEETKAPTEEAKSKAGVSQLDPRAPVRIAYRELKLDEAETSLKTHRQTKTCNEPELGTAMGSGASDHPTMLRIFPQFNSGVIADDFHSNRCARPKLPILLPTGKAIPGEDFPGHAPITVAQIGTHYIVGVPAELTTMTGARLRDAVAKALADAKAEKAKAEKAKAAGKVEPATPEPNEPAVEEHFAKSIVVVGLVNEYIQYVTTPEEYELQLYEGASTLYGPASAQLLTDQAACLARWLELGDDSECKHGQLRGINDVYDVKYPDSIETIEVLEKGACQPSPPSALSKLETSVTSEGLLAFSVQFKGPEPERVQRRDQLWVEVWRLDGANEVLVEDDRGTTITTRYHPYGEAWTASWLPEITATNPARANFCGKVFKLRVGSGGVRSDSSAFTLDCDKLQPALSKEWP